MSRNTFLNPQWVRRLPPAHLSPCGENESHQEIAEEYNNVSTLQSRRIISFANGIQYFTLVWWTSIPVYCIFSIMKLAISAICHCEIQYTHCLLSILKNFSLNDWEEEEEAFKNKPKYPKPTWMLILTDSSHQITMTVSSIAQSLQSSVHPLTIHREQITDIHLCNDETLTDGCGEEVRAQYSTVQGGWGVQRRAIRWETVSKYQIINNYRR